MGSGDVISPFLTLALDGGKWSASLPGRFTPSTYWTGGWVGARAGLYAMEKKSCPCRESNPSRSTRRVN
jgi:hypothetical protein